MLSSCDVESSSIISSLITELAIEERVVIFRMISTDGRNVPLFCSMASREGRLVFLFCCLQITSFCVTGSKLEQFCPREYRVPCHRLCNCCNIVGKVTIQCEEPLQLQQIGLPYQMLHNANEIVFTDSGLHQLPGLCKMLRPGDKYSQLKVLNVAFNNISGISRQDFSCFPILKRLNITENKLKVLHDYTFSDLKQLTHLDLSHNQIRLIENQVFMSTQNFSSLIPKIQTVLLNHNQLKNMELWAFVHKDMRLFNFTHNFISKLTNKEGMDITNIVNNVKEGAYIDIRHNKLETLQLQNLSIYGVRDFKFMWQIFRYDIDARNNPWICDCKLYKTLAALKLFITFFKDEPFFHMKCAAPKSFRGKEGIKVLDMLVCPEYSDCPKNCTCVKRSCDNRLIAYCDNTHKTELPMKIPSDEDITELHLTGNKIKSLDNRYYLNKTKELHLGNNELNFISNDSINNLQKVDILNISHNALTILPSLVQNLSPKRYIDITHNPFTCSCGMLWMKDWLYRKRATIVNAEKVICFYKGKQIHIVELDPEAIDCIAVKTVTDKTTGIMISVGGIVALALIFFIGIRFHYELKVLITLKLNMQCWRDKDDIKSLSKYKFDVRLIFFDDIDNARETLWVKEKLMRLLEKDHKPPFRVCIESRDFVESDYRYWVQNADICLTVSRRVIVVFSQNFFRDEECMHQFRVASDQVIRQKLNNLIIILYDDVNREDFAKRKIKISHARKCIWKSENLFKEKLLYELPRFPLHTLLSDMTKPLMSDSNSNNYQAV